MATIDEAAYTTLVAPLRAELHAFCYRMLGSVHDADDAVQDALLRTWRGMDRFEERGSVRSWLYTIATNVCLDAMSSRGKRALPVDLRPPSEQAVPDGEPITEIPWLGPIPGPDVAYELRESVELAFVAALQHLPGNQRAALLLFNVLGFSVREIAETMATSPPATWSMPPRADWYCGKSAIADFLTRMPLLDRWRHVPTTANGQLAVACYRDDEGAYVAYALDVLDVRDDRIASVTAFIDTGLFKRFGLPLQLS
jgi:RNA polymerase sigma-70 factor (ECF subfamily)